MAKVMLVEDDTNLSEIYQARLTAEGYNIVSAHDGEAALALAAKEKPDLIISDVMMPKISGFEMLDILRNTDGLKSTKVIMLTALGQAEDKTRAEALSADRYLVKSQVTLEDIVKAAQELLNGDGDATAVPAAVAAATPAPSPTPAPTPMTPAPTPVTATPAPATPIQASPVPAPAPSPAPVVSVAPVAVAAAQPATPTMPAPQIPVAQPPAATPVEPAPSTALPTAPPPSPVTPVAQPAPAFTPPTSTPLSEPVTPASADSVTADNQLVTDAVKDLQEAVQPAPAPAAAPSTPETANNPAPAVEPPAAPAAETENTNNSTGDNVAIAHKKIIQPIPADGQAPSKPSLESLLADEERKNPGATSQPSDATQNRPAAPPAVPHQPGHVVSPDAGSASPSTNTGIDPNSIAL